MLAFISIFIPGIIALKVDSILSKSEYSFKEMFLNYGLYTFLCHLISMVIAYYVLGLDYNFEALINLYPGVTVKYMGTTLFVQFVIVTVKTFISRNVVMEVEDKKH